MVGHVRSNVTGVAGAHLIIVEELGSATGITSQLLP